MNGASDENAENRFGGENEENEHFLRRKGRRKCRPSALAYRDTNIGRSINQKRELLHKKRIYETISGKSLFLDKRRKHDTFQVLLYFLTYK